MSRHALIVEDDAGLRKIYERVLLGMDYSVSEASDGETALALLEHETPNLLFLDIQLPGTNGETVLEFIQQSEHLRHMFVVIVSSNKHYARYVELLPAAAFVLKPILPHQIRQYATQIIA